MSARLKSVFADEGIGEERHVCLRVVGQEVVAAALLIGKPDRPETA
jgi:hypothetical protein